MIRGKLALSENSPVLPTTAAFLEKGWEALEREATGQIGWRLPCLIWATKTTGSSRQGCVLSGVQQHLRKVFVRLTEGFGGETTPQRQLSEAEMEGETVFRLLRVSSPLIMSCRLSISYSDLPGSDFQRLEG